MKAILTVLFLFITCSIFAQDGVGSYESDNGRQSIEAGTFKMVYSESLYLGPNSNWVIDGDLHIYSKKIWISPTAKITGAGRITIHNPGDNPMYDSWASQPTQIDGNDGEFIDVNIALANNQGLHLINLSSEGYPDQAAGTANERLAALKIGKTLILDVDGAHVFLKNHDLELSFTAKFLNDGPRRFVVTDNSSTGHLIKNYGISKAEFNFPVGIAPDDYTPARLKPSQTNSKIFVSVTDYTAALALGITFEDETIGMDRIWNIYADKAMQMDYTLVHNMSTNGIAYVDPNAQIVQRADDGIWIGDITTFEGMGIHTRKDIDTKVGNTLAGTWFTKLTNTPPTAVDDYVSVTYEQEQSIDVLINDLAGNSPIIRNLVEIVRMPQNGKADVINGSIVYIPNDGYVGTDVIEYRITDRNGLTATAFLYIEVLPRHLFIPNIITPNGDGKNDAFVIVGMEAYQQVGLLVFNRWGNEVFSDRNYVNNWTGRGLNEGTYYYVIEATAKNGEKKIYKGFITIKRA